MTSVEFVHERMNDLISLVVVSESEVSSVKESRRSLTANDDVGVAECSQRAIDVVDFAGQWNENHFGQPLNRTRKRSLENKRTFAHD